METMMSEVQSKRTLWIDVGDFCYGISFSRHILEQKILRKLQMLKNALNLILGSGYLI